MSKLCCLSYRKYTENKNTNFLHSFRKCNAIDKIICNMDNKTLSLKCERSFL